MWSRNLGVSLKLCQKLWCLGRNSLGSCYYCRAFFSRLCGPVSTIYLFGTWSEERFWCWPELDVMSGLVVSFIYACSLEREIWEENVSFCGGFLSELEEIVNFRWILTGGQLAQLSSIGTKPMDMASRFPVTILCQFKQSNEVSFIVVFLMTHQHILSSIRRGARECSKWKYQVVGREQIHLLLPVLHNVIHAGL